MNSKQINFFLMPSDVAEINHFLRDNGYSIIENRSTTSKISFVKNININPESSKQYFLCAPEFKDEIFMKQVDAQNFYVDVAKSKVVEFDIGGMYDTKELHRSRLYFVTAYYQGIELFSKSEDFLTWASKLKSQFKKHFLIKGLNQKSILFSRKTNDWIHSVNATLKEGGFKLIKN